MSKKISIVPTLIALTISTLGLTVPTFAEPNETYYVSDLAPLHSQYAADMAECGVYNRYSSTFMDCYNRITNEYRTKYGGKFESMYQLDYNGRMVVTSLNPAAGTVRLYIDETKAYRGDAFTFQNLVVFWADSTVNPSPDWDDDIAWNIVDAVLRGEEAPQGVHILYKGIKNEEGWITPNTEYHANYVPSGDFTRDNSAKFFFVLGYDTNGVKHLERNSYSGCIDGFTEGEECRLRYTYDGSSTSKGYIRATATPEDTAIIELKNAIKAAEEATAIAKEAEKTAREAIEAADAAAARLAEAEANAREAEATAREAEANARNAEAVAREAELIAKDAETVANQATVAAREAEESAKQAEANAREIEAAAKQAEANARETEVAAKAAEANAKAAEIAAREAEANAISAEASARVAQAEAERIAREATEAIAIANQIAEAAMEASENATRTAENATKTASESTKIAETATKAAEDAKQIVESSNQITTEEIKKSAEISATLITQSNELSQKIADLSNRIANSSSNTQTIEKIIEKVVPITDDTTISSNTSTRARFLATSEPVTDSEDYLEIPITGEEAEFPWWIIAFVFSGIVLILWWFIPTKKYEKSIDK